MAAFSDERKLVTEAQTGSREAFEKLLDAYEDKVFSLVRRMVGPQDAEDVAQDALIEFCKSIASFRGKSSLSTWVYRVTVNVCLEHRRKHRPEVIPFEEDFGEYEVDHSDDPLDATMRNQLKTEVETAIGSLSDIHRDVVILHEIQGLTYQECAEVFGCPVGTVKSRLSNAFVKLRELLKEHAVEGGLVI
jgi:RNA polymerase sigma-70 factor (ECF subfamily)